jgi:peptidoglycan/xylan/chitin deacetylase (PgdA/CDA1 family)
MKEIAGIDPNILAITPTVDGSCANDPSAAADTSRCWWTCGGCVNATSDVATCPDKNTWGVSFDDGPAPYTPKVLHFLDQNHLNATFFAIGSRIVERPAILQAEYMSGHHISVHTWSHSIPLTALTNAQIVAELGWGRQAIKETLGVTPITMRPPWGDADNRVRAISMAMGLKPIFWTREPTTLAQFDTNDWRVVAGQVTGAQSEEQFQSILANASLLDTGFIVLEHDLFQQEVDLSTGNFLPQALAKGFTLMDINSCRHLANTEAYLETVQNKSSIPTYPGAGGIDISGNGTVEGGNPSATGSSGGASGGAQGGGSSGSGSSAGVRLRVGSALVGLALPLGALAALL